MYRDSYQRGMLTVFFSGGSKPMEIWESKTRDGYIKRFLDPEIKTMVLEIRGHNISTTFMSCPKGNQVLGITMPFLVMIVKNLMKYFSFEVTVLDSTGTRRRFRVSNFQSTTQILPLCTVMPIGLAPGWNQIQFNLAEFTRRAYKNQFVEVQRLKINANIRLRRIYFTERLMSDDELPVEYKLYFPLQQKGPKVVKDIETDKENIQTPPQEPEKKKSITDPSKPTSRTLSVGAIKKSRKSLAEAPASEQKIKDKASEGALDESAARLSGEKLPEEIVPGEEKQPSDELQATEEEQIDAEPGTEEPITTDEENKLSEELVSEEMKGDEIENKEAQGDEGDKGDDYDKPVEGENIGEVEKPAEEEEVDKPDEGDT